MKFLASHPADAGMYYSNLARSIALGSLEAVEALVDFGIDINHMFEDGFTPLIHAVFKRNQTMTEALIEFGADPDKKDYLGVTALIHAACLGSIHDRYIINSLCRLGANINSVDEDGKTALMHAVISNHPKIVSTLLVHNPDLDLKDSSGMSAIMYACKANNVELINMLCAHGADVSGVDIINLHMDEDDTIDYGTYIEILTILCEHGADINQTDEAGKSTLIHAAEKSESEIIGLLATLGADINLRDNAGSCALDYAVQDGNFDLADLLCTHGASIDHIDITILDSMVSLTEDEYCNLISVLHQHGANIHKTNAFGQNLIHIACGNMSVHILERLHGMNIDINKQDDDGSTPLIFTLEKYHGDPRSIAIIEKLCDLGANVHMKDKTGANALTWAAKKKLVEAVDVICNKVVNINHVDKYGMTPLLWAVSTGDAAVVEEICKHGADVNKRKGYPKTMAHGHSKRFWKAINHVTQRLLATDLYHSTPLMLACRLGYSEIVSVLCDFNANLRLKDRRGKTALDIARDEGESHIAQTLTSIAEERVDEKIEIQFYDLTSSISSTASSASATLANSDDSIGSPFTTLGTNRSRLFASVDLGSSSDESSDPIDEAVEVVLCQDEDTICRFNPIPSLFGGKI